ADLRLGGVVDDEALAFLVNAIDQAALVGAGVKRAIAGLSHAEDVLLLGGVENAGFPFLRDLIDAALRARAREDRAGASVCRQTPNVGFGRRAEDAALTSRIDADDAARR